MRWKQGWNHRNVKSEDKKENQKEMKQRMLLEGHNCVYAEWTLSAFPVDIDHWTRFTALLFLPDLYVFPAVFCGVVGFFRFKRAKAYSAIKFKVNAIEV